MSPKNKIKLNLLRKKLDKLDYQLLKTIKKRTEIVKKVLTLKSYKKEIIDKKRISVILKKIRKESLKRKGEKIDDKKEIELLKTITDKYKRQSSPYYAAAHLWIDAIIDPLDTRKMISIGIEAANNAPIKKAYNPGIIQS